MDHLKITLRLYLISAKIAYKMLAVSAEMVCRTSFGSRYAPTMLASFMCSFVILNLLRTVVPQQVPQAIDIYLFTLFIMVLIHLTQMWRPRATIQSFSNGQSLALWRRYNLNPTTVRTIIEPLISVGIGILSYEANHLLSVWLQLGGVCLCIKELLATWQHRNRILDSIDARMEGERIGNGVRQQTAPQPGGEQQFSPVVPADSGQQPVSTIQQIYSQLDPALRRLIADTYQMHLNADAHVQPNNRPELVGNQVPPPRTLPRNAAAEKRPKPPWHM